MTEPAGAQTTSSELDPTEVAALDATLSKLVAAWNAGDLEAYARPFTDDAVYVTYFGRKLIGRGGIAEGHRRVFASAYRTYVLVKDDGEWRIASFHNARVSNPAD
jgi:hypothetical protein